MVTSLWPVPPHPNEEIHLLLKGLGTELREVQALFEEQNHSLHQPIHELTSQRSKWPYLYTKVSYKSCCDLINILKLLILVK